MALLRRSLLGMNRTSNDAAALLAPRAPAKSGMKTSISSPASIRLFAQKVNREIGPVVPAGRVRHHPYGPCEAAEYKWRLSDAALDGLRGERRWWMTTSGIGRTGGSDADLGRVVRSATAPAADGGIARPDRR